MEADGRIAHGSTWPACQVGNWLVDWLMGVALVFVCMVVRLCWGGRKVGVGDQTDRRTGRLADGLTNTTLHSLLTISHSPQPHTHAQWHVKYAYRYTPQGLIDPNAVYWAEIISGAGMGIAYKIKGRFPPTVYFSWQVRRCVLVVVVLCGVK